eukprot:GHUV01010839.1.p1 GENE.GHUV01010839.1~~GHUV01010839.1.p1  ORF type:complete len:474 (+),score=103.97 GHUV01010839.1:86-1423(+)
MLAAQKLTRTGSCSARVSNPLNTSSLPSYVPALSVGPQCRPYRSSFGVSSRRQEAALRVAQVETFSVDATGSLTWDAHKDPNGSMPATAILEGYTLRPGQVPAAAPTSTLPTRPDSFQRSSKPVVLVRDTNGWCPFCERVWIALEEKQIPYDCVLIELYNKPTWYKDLVPTALVPAVAFSEDGSVVWESKDILLALEERFPATTPLLPTETEERTKALEFMSELEDCGIDKHGYAFMTGGRMIGRAAQNAPGTPAPDIASLEKAFVSVLDWFEGTALTRHTEGPYLLGEHFSLLDVMVISSMERLAAGLPKFRGFELRSNPKYPNTAAWFEAISARPAYQKVCSDDQTLQLLFQRMMGLSSGAAAAVSSSSAAAAAGAGHGSSSSIDPDAARLDALMVGKGDYVKRMHEVVKLCKKITSAQPGPRWVGGYLLVTNYNYTGIIYNI